jgi:Transketolase, C-terminal subunit
MKAQRQVWGETLAALADVDQRILVLDADLATSTKADIVAARHPDRFIEVGIAEQNMVGMAFGLSTLGYRPWLSTFSVFLTHRALDQVRMLVSQTKAPVRLGGAYSGLLNGSSGKTHQDIEDLAIMRAMPNMTVIAPADEHEVRAAIQWAAEHDGPVYIRLARDAVAPVFDENVEFRLGVPVMLTDGDDLVVVSTGVQTSRVYEAVQMLRESGGPKVRLIHLATIKPVDEDALRSAVGDGSHIVTIEEHSRIGGLGGLVSEIFSLDRDIIVTRIGLEDRWAESAPNDFLLDKYGLSMLRVAEALRVIARDSFAKQS